MESCKEQKAIEIGDLSALDSRIKTKTLKMYKATMVSTQMNKTDKLQKHIEYFKVLDPESERLVLKHFNFASSVDQLRSENDYNAVCRNKKQSKSLKVRSLSSSSLSTGKVSNTIFESPISADLKERSGIECGQISDKSQLFYQQKNLSEQRKIMLDIARRRRKKILNNLQYLDLHTRLSTNDVPRSTSQCDGKRQFVPEHNQSVSVTRTTSSGDAINETYIFSHQPSQKQLDQILSTASSDDGKSFVSDDKKLTINTQNNGEFDYSSFTWTASSTKQLRHPRVKKKYHTLMEPTEQVTKILFTELKNSLSYTRLKKKKENTLDLLGLKKFL